MTCTIVFIEQGAVHRQKGPLSRQHFKNKASINNNSINDGSVEKGRDCHRLQYCCPCRHLPSFSSHRHGRYHLHRFLRSHIFSRCVIQNNRFSFSCNFIFVASTDVIDQMCTSKANSKRSKLHVVHHFLSWFFYRTTLIFLTVKPKCFLFHLFLKVCGVGF